MFDLDPEKLLILGIVALVVLGPDRLPNAARTLGRIIGQLRAMSASFQTEVRDALGEPGEVLTAINDLPRPGSLGRTVRRGVTSAFISPATSGADGTTPTGDSLPGPIQPGAAAPGAPDDPSLN